MSPRNSSRSSYRCSLKSFSYRFFYHVFVYLHFSPPVFFDTHVTALAAAAAGPSSSSSSCPTACFCNAPSRIVYCSRRGLAAVPDGVAADSLQLNLNGNVFQSTTLRRGNFSGMAALEHLYLSECGIERLEVGTFADLTQLRWLDLSNNRIRSIAERQFAGLSLQHLFLNGNRHIDLRATSFDGLVTTGLYLHDCSLSSLQVEVLAPLNSSLRYLWLNGNELTTVVVAHRVMFSSLSHLRLGSNPLHCNCETSWLKELFDTTPDVFKGAAAPSCLTPQKLRGRHFTDISSNDFRCQAPAFNNIETAFGADVGGARLRCTATGDPAPTLYWIQPSGKTTRYGPPADEEARRNEGLLVVRETAAADADPSTSSVFGMYICVANNDAGNVTLTINVSWPFVTAPRSAVEPSTTESQSVTSRLAPVISPSSLFTAPTNPHRTHRPDRSNSIVVVTTEAAARHRPSDGDHTNYTVLHDVTGRGGGDTVGDSDVEAELIRRHHQRLFTVTELVCAVIGTHVGTLIVCVVLLPLIYRRRRQMVARDKRDRAVVIAGLQPTPPAYGTTTTTTNSTAVGAPPMSVGVGRRIGGSTVGLETDCKPLYHFPQNTLPSIPNESVYLNGAPYSTARRHHQQQQQQQQQQTQYYHQQPDQHNFLTNYLLTSQRR